MRYVAYVCNQATVYDYASPVTQQRMARDLERRRGEPLKAALLDTNAAAKGEPCVCYYLTTGPEGRPRLCGNPNFRACYHQLQCAECGAYIERKWRK